MLYVILTENTKIKPIVNMQMKKRKEPKHNTMKMLK